MMHGRGKSDPGIVAVKPANNAEQSAAELVEPRTGTKGNADQQSTRRAQYRESVSQALGRIRQVSPSSTRGRSRMHKGARPDLCGGRGATRVPTATLIVSRNSSISPARVIETQEARRGASPPFAEI